MCDGSEGATIALCMLRSTTLRLVPSNLGCSMDQKGSATRAIGRLRTTTRRLGTTRQPASNPTKFTRCEKLWIDSDAHRVLEDKTRCCVPPQPICGATCSAPHGPTAQCRELQNKRPQSFPSGAAQPATGARAIVSDSGMPMAEALAPEQLNAPCHSDCRATPRAAHSLTRCATTQRALSARLAVRGVRCAMAQRAPPSRFAC